MVPSTWCHKVSFILKHMVSKRVSCTRSPCFSRFNRAVSLNPSLGDAWAAYFAFELSQGSVHEQRDLVREGDRRQAQRLRSTGSSRPSKISAPINEYSRDQWISSPVSGSVSTCAARKVLRFAEAQPNQGIEWNPIAKQTRCWRLKWPQRLRLSAPNGPRHP